MPGFLRPVIRRAYDTILRHRLPRTIGVYNGVVTRKYHLLDLTKNDHEPEYKETLVSRVRAVTDEGDDVVEIGSGFGVCTVWLAKEVGREGVVSTYEAGDDQVAVTREALALNSEILGEDLTVRTSVNHALVVSGNVIYGPSSGVTRLDVSDLPGCDVMVTDCEGAELQILRDLEIRPRAFIIETHPNFGAKTSDVEAILSEYGYQCETEYLYDTDSGPKHILIGRKNHSR